MLNTVYTVRFAKVPGFSFVPVWRFLAWSAGARCLLSWRREGLRHRKRRRSGRLVFGTVAGLQSGARREELGGGCPTFCEQGGARDRPALQVNRNCFETTPLSRCLCQKARPPRRPSRRQQRASTRWPANSCRHHGEYLEEAGFSQKRAASFEPLKSVCPFQSAGFIDFHPTHVARVLFGTQMFHDWQGMDAERAGLLILTAMPPLLLTFPSYPQLHLPLSSLSGLQPEAKPR